VLLAAHYKAANANTHLFFPPVFLFLHLYTYYILHFSSTLCTQRALGPTQPPVHWVQGALSSGVKCGQGVMLTTHPLLVPGLGKRGAIPPLLPSAFLGVWGFFILSNFRRLTRLTSLSTGSTRTVCIYAWCTVRKSHLPIVFFQVKEFLQHFWKEVPLHFMGILGSNAVVNMVGVCDSVLYRTIAGMFVPSSRKVSVPINSCNSASRTVFIILPQYSA
jgi:hypothetical protein